MRECDWISSTQQFGHILEKFGSYAIEFWLGHKLGKSWKISHKMQLNFGQDTTWQCLRVFSIRCNLISAKTQFGNVSEYILWGAIEFGLWVSLDTSLNNLDQVQLNYGLSTILKFLRVAWDAIDFWLRRNMRKSENMFDKMQLKFGSDTIWNCLRIFSIGCNQISAKTHFGHILDWFRSDATESWLRDILTASYNFFKEMQLNFG